MASVESMDRRVRPHRYARRRLDFQLAAYRLLVFDICFSFVNLIEAPERTLFAGRTLFFRGMEISGGPFPTHPVTSKIFPRTCTEYINRCIKLRDFFQSIHEMLSQLNVSVRKLTNSSRLVNSLLLMRRYSNLT